MYEITFIDTGETVQWSGQKAAKVFGRDEWKEIKANYLPHIVVVKIK